MRGIRTRLLLAVLGAVALAVAAMTVGFNLILARSLSHNANDLARARASAQLAALRPAGGRLEMGETPDEALGETQLWVFSRGRAVESPRAAATVTAAARSLAGRTARFLDVSGADVRLYSAPAIFDGKRLGTVVAGVSLAPYEQTRRTALITFSTWLSVMLEKIGRLATRANSAVATGNCPSSSLHCSRQ